MDAVYIGCTRAGLDPPAPHSPYTSTPMTTSARLCASCGSALPETPYGVLQVKCLFCGVVNDLRPASGPVTVHVDAGEAVRAAATVGRTVVWVVSLAIGLAIAGAGVGLYVATRSVTQVTRTIADTVVRQAQPRPVAPADLAASTVRGWQTLDVVTPPTAWAAFDPVAGLDWAIAIGRAWQDDAVLTRIDVARLTPAGTVNLEGSPDDTAGYRFISPGQVKAWNALARRGDSNPEVGYELMLTLAQGAVKAIVVRGRPMVREEPPAPKAVLPLTAILAKTAPRPGFADVLFFDGYMIHLEREGWVWYLSGRGVQASLPRLRAIDGAAYPYRR